MQEISAKLFSFRKFSVEINFSWLKFKASFPCNILQRVCNNCKETSFLLEKFMQVLVSLVHNELNFFQKECFDMAVIGPHLAWAWSKSRK